MKRNDNGTFCVLSIESLDVETDVLDTIVSQKKPVVLILTEQAQAFRQTEDFTALKQMKRLLALPIMFVIPTSEYLIQLAERNGFPVYPSIDVLNKAYSDISTTSQTAEYSSQTRTTHPLTPPTSSAIRTLAPQQEAQRGRVQREELSHIRVTGPIWGEHSMPTLSKEHDVADKITAPLSQLGHQPRREKAQVSMQNATSQHQASSPQKHSRPQRRLSVTLIVLMLLAICATSAGYFLKSLHTTSANTLLGTQPILGHVYFLSSEQVSENSNQGIDDEVQVSLTHITNPAPQKNYYAWLLGDKDQAEAHSIFLGTAQVHNGAIDVQYSGDKAHTNLLAVASRFLITEEDATVTPITPSLDYSTWKYYAEFPQVPLTPSNITNEANNGSTTKTYTFLDHLRHLLASDPLLDEMELPGGLNNWLYRNMGKVLEWTGSTRENWEEARDVNYIRRQVTRTLTYLDGTSFVQMDLPPNTALNVNERLARVGLLEMNGSNQNPPCYLDHISLHLNGLVQATNASPTLRKQASAILAALNNVHYWLNNIHQDASQLIKMNDNQLNQPGTLTLLNDMIANANLAYVGQNNPTTDELQPGIVWIHEHIQALAALDVTAYKVQGA